jgi:hypothetical protein
MQRQIKLQEAAFRQWITFKNWEVTPELGQDDLRLDFTFQIANTTKFPLTIDGVVVESGGILGHTEIPLTEPDSVGYVIPPGEGRRMNHEALLNSKSKKLYEENFGAPTFLEVKVTYTDCLERLETQSVFLTCTSYRDRPAKFGFYGSSQERGKEKEKEQDLGR